MYSVIMAMVGILVTAFVIGGVVTLIAKRLFGFDDEQTGVLFLVMFAAVFFGLIRVAA